MFQNWEKVEPEHALALLKRLQELFSVQDRWIEWPLSETKAGIECLPNDPDATKFSLLGACELFAQRAHPKPLCEFVMCATYEYLDELSNGKMIKGETGYGEEISLIGMGIKELSNDQVNSN